MLFQEFATAHSKLKQEFNYEVADFIKQYPAHKELAKQNKGDLYQEFQYPDVSTLQSMFSVTLTALPFPSTEDFRITAPAEVIEELQATMADTLARVGDVISQDLTDRLNKRLKMLHKTLTVGQRFSTSLLTEIATVVSTARSLRDSISEDLDKKMVVVEDQILTKNAETIRNSVTLQTEIAEVCQKLLTS
jgi:hypothetical protein